MAKADMIATAFGVAQYPSVNAPDTFGAFATHKYKISVSVSKEDLAKFVADFTAKVGPIPKGFKVPWKEKDGTYTITAKSKYAPVIVGMDKAPIEFEEGQYLSGGSEVRILAEIGPYKGGFTLYLKKVQVRKLVTGNTGGADFDDFSGEDDTVETEDALDL